MPSSLSCGNACVNIIVMAAVEREMPAWQWIKRWRILAYITAERQDRLDVRPLRQDDPGAGLDLIVKIQRRAQVGIESAERRWFRPLRIENG